ncbi:MAG: ATP F0F1 synthase subunit B [Pseudomonadota bacterium]
MRRLTPLAVFAALTSPAFAAGEGSYDFTSFFNTDYVVLIGFLLFIAILFWFNVPALLGGMLDSRAAQIRADLDEARALREEAQSILADYERKARDVKDQADRIVAAAQSDAASAAEQAKAELAASITRRLAAAEDQIANAEEKAVSRVRSQAVDVAIAAAADVLKGQASAAGANDLIDASIAQVADRLN